MPRNFIRSFLLPLLTLIAFWVGLWLYVPQIRENLNAVNLLIVLLLLAIFLLTAPHFVGKALEDYGYSREDVRRLPEILEKTWGRSYLPKEVQDIIGRHVMLWGFFATAVIMTGNLVEGVIGTASVFAVIFAFFIVGVSMAIWIIILPLSIYRVLTGKEPDKTLLKFVILYTLVFTGILIVVRLIALHVNPGNPAEFLDYFFRFGRNTRVFNGLLKLSGLNVLFGLAGFYAPRKIGRLSVPVMLAIAIAQL
ncbi:hypothetical protein E3E35_00780 [Thermococcus sp. GR7]|uniref:hypothetical protein n=1 Tax=unclassified Thermococcus TaxID=2627626 RepID=UPI00142F5206|nr:MULTISPECIES: hypothetical protein [unclassified Thermococcus]NJE45964.1 hypothetical protein [Thermococcus sp. GR7]NJE78457.1 hypothetical protein [Thermococcus sp. GR4]NJF22160.1 hypothetical protein [Thermococcus sp. GR5]